MFFKILLVHFSPPFFFLSKKKNQIFFLKAKNKMGFPAEARPIFCYFGFEFMIDKLENEGFDVLEVLQTMTDQ